MDPRERWATENTVTIQRYVFERTLAHLPNDIERIALIRAAYGCDLREAKELLAAWRYLVATRKC